jgi:hypothetical protein
MTSLSQVSDADLSRWIAEKLEPFASMMENNSAICPFSPLNCWHLVDVLRKKPEKSTTEWQPRDMVHDAAMTVMLLEKLIRNCSHLVFQHWPDGCRLDMHELSRQQIAVPAETVGRAVAEAFALAHGWSEEKG